MKTQLHWSLIFSNLRNKAQRKKENILIYTNDQSTASYKAHVGVPMPSAKNIESKWVGRPTQINNIKCLRGKP